MTARRERFEVTPDEEGLRLDQFLPRRVSGLSRRKARVLVDLGGVYVDRARVKVASRPLRRGQVVEAVLGTVLEQATSGVGAAARDADAATLPPYEVVFEDPHIIVVDKPAGLVTAPTPESDRGNLLDLLQRRGGPVWLVHRIDRDTSGLLIFARTPAANLALGERFARHDVERVYVAVVAGALSGARTIDRPIRGKRAVTHVEPVEALDGATRVRARLETGRTHQIRIHLAGEGHPVLGDREHGGETARLHPHRPPRLALHAAVLGIAHPETGEILRWERDLPPDLAGWLESHPRAPGG